MNSTISHSSFSWKRVCGFARIFRRQIGLQLLIYSCAYIAFTSLIMLVGVDSAFFTPIVMIFGCATSLMVYLIPLPLRWGRSAQAMLYPASTAEKFTFFAGYTLVLCPLAISALSALYYFVGSLCYHTNFYTLCTLHVRVGNSSSYIPAITGMFDDPATIVTAWFSGIVWNALIVIAGLAVVLFQKRHAAVKCILVPLCITLGLGFICGIGGSVAALAGISDQITDPAFILKFMARFLTLLSLLLLAVEILIIWRIYRHYLRMNIC